MLINHNRDEGKLSCEREIPRVEKRAGKRAVELQTATTIQCHSFYAA